MRRRFLVACAVGFPRCGAAAQEAGNPDLARAAMTNMSDEATTCGAFYTVVSQCLANTPTNQSQELSRRYDEASDNAFLLAFAYGEMAEMQEEAVLAAAELALNGMWDRIANNCANIAILTRDHANICQSAMTLPEERLTYWLERLRPQFPASPDGGRR